MRERWVAVAIMAAPTGLWARPVAGQGGAAAAAPPRMPYVAVHDPEFVPASKATFARDADLVIGVAKGRVAKAYMVLDLMRHGSVDDEMPDGPIEATWCSTCGTGAVFRAELHGRRLHFEYDGMVNANEVHKDVETGSRWQQSTGEAISGPANDLSMDTFRCKVIYVHASCAVGPTVSERSPIGIETSAKPKTGRTVEQ